MDTSKRTKCDFGDCFANKKGKCIILQPTYENEEECPFYKIDEKHTQYRADVESYEYAIRRIEHLEDVKKAQLLYIEDCKKNIQQARETIKNIDNEIREDKKLKEKYQKVCIS